MSDRSRRLESDVVLTRRRVSGVLSRPRTHHQPVGLILYFEDFFYNYSFRVLVTKVLVI